MSIFTVDRQKCIRDGWCARVCPSQIIALYQQNDGYPAVLENDKDLCISCGHCASVCPASALALDAPHLRECAGTRPELLPEAAQVRQFLMSRRSIRFYQNQPVSRDLIEELINTARYAPTASNKQQVNWIVVDKPSDVQKLASLVIEWKRDILPFITNEIMARKMKNKIAAWERKEDGILRGAPHLVIVYAPADASFAEADCVTALSYFELYAFAKGLGTCWAGYFTAAANFHEPLKKALNIPQGCKCFGAVMLGCPQYKYQRIPARNAPNVFWHC